MQILISVDEQIIKTYKETLDRISNLAKVTAIPPKYINDRVVELIDECFDKINEIVEEDK